MPDKISLTKQLKKIKSEITINSCLHHDKYYELLLILHILLVKNQIRNVCYDEVSLKKQAYFAECTNIESVIIDHLGDEGKMQLSSLNTLKKIASELGIQIHESNHSYFYLNKNDIIPNTILDKFSKTFGYGKYVWLYNNNSVKNSIKKVIQGNVRIGDFLGYPKCCVDWLTETQTQSLIDCYYFYHNNHLTSLSENFIVDFMQDYFESNLVPDNERRIIEITKKHVIKTIQKYPFVFHQACTSCLKNNESHTAKLNKIYENFAKHISEKFYQKILVESKITIKNYEKI